MKSYDSQIILKFTQNEKNCFNKTKLFWNSFWPIHLFQYKLIHQQNLFLEQQKPFPRECPTLVYIKLLWQMVQM